MTASAGNMAQGVAWAAREAGVKRDPSIAPETAPRTKLDRGGNASARPRIPVPIEEWWQAMVNRSSQIVEGLWRP